MSKKLDIISLYLPDYTQAVTGREIARRASISPQAALTTLNHLVKQRVPAHKIKGRNKEYSLNLKDMRIGMQYYNEKFEKQEIQQLINKTQQFFTKIKEITDNTTQEEIQQKRKQIEKIKKETNTLNNTTK